MRPLARPRVRKTNDGTSMETGYCLCCDLWGPGWLVANPHTLKLPRSFSSISCQLVCVRICIALQLSLGQSVLRWPF